MSEQNRRDDDPTLSALYDLTRDQEPPLDLDQKIQQAAHNRPVPARSSIPAHSSRWHVPLAIAAMLVLSMGIVNMIDREEPARLMAPELPEPMATEEIPVETLATTAQPAAVPEQAAAATSTVAAMQAQQEAAPLPRASVPGRRVIAEEARKQPGLLNKAGKQAPAGTAPGPQAQMASPALMDSMVGEEKAEAEMMLAPAAPMTAPVDADEISPAMEQALHAVAQQLAQNNKPEAVRLFRAFRKQYPHYPVTKLEQRFGKVFVTDVIAAEHAPDQ